MSSSVLQQVRVKDRLAKKNLCYSYLTSFWETIPTGPTSENRVVILPLTHARTHYRCCNCRCFHEVVTPILPT